MVASLLLEIDIQEGRELLERLDAAGVAPQAAFWAHEPDAERWRLVLAFAEYDEVGPLPVYKKVLPLTEPDSDISVSGISATGLKDEMVKLVRARFANRLVSPERPRHTMVGGRDVVVDRV